MVKLFFQENSKFKPNLFSGFKILELTNPRNKKINDIINDHILNLTIIN